MDRDGFRDALGRVGRFGVATLLVAAVVFVGGLAVTNAAGATHSFVVLSGSMEPTLQKGDVVVVRSVTPAEVEVGDVITFRPADDAGEPGSDRITHRVVGKRHTDGGVVYRTKGDANESADQRLVDHSQIVGEMWFHVPLVGYALLLAQRPLAQVILVIIPGLLLLKNGIETLAGA